MTNGPISTGTGTADDPWQLETPPLSSEYTMHRDTRDGVAVIVCTVGKTVLLYDAHCLDGLHAMLVEAGDWVPLGSEHITCDAGHEWSCGGRGQLPANPSPADRGPPSVASTATSAPGAPERGCPMRTFASARLRWPTVR